MVTALVETGRYRIIYRPHPRTGIFDASYKDSNKRVVELLARANSADPNARHVIDSDSDFGWHLDAADICIADISAVAFDWLAVGKPIVLTRPSSPEAEVEQDGIAGSLLTVNASDAGSIITYLDHANDPEQVAARKAIVARHFGDVTPGASMQRWVAAATRVIGERTPDAGTGTPVSSPGGQAA